MRGQQRIYDFQQRTFINYPNVTLLIRNMPLDDSERYGRIKDLLPTSLGALNNKIINMMAEQVMQQQADELTVSFDEIKSSLLSLSNSLMTNQTKSSEALNSMVNEMHVFLPKLALEEDQEAYIIDFIEKAAAKSLQLNDNTEEMGETFQSIVSSLQMLIDNHNQKLTDLQNRTKLTDQSDIQANYTSDVDLF